jgi:NarL family two-component system sensor histidine kinase LiaS
METAAKDSMAEIRSFLEGKADYNLLPGTLVEKIEEDMKFLRDGIGLKMVLETEPEELNLPPAIEKELYFVLGEGLLNVARHSHASEAELIIKATNGELRASLVDDGIGFDVEAARPGGGYGLTNMEERVKKLGGRFSVASIPGKGTKLSFVVSLRS